MHIAFVCLPAAGHVNPTLPVVAELARRGHRVTYATSDKYAKAVEATGAGFFRSGKDLSAWFPRRAHPADGDSSPMMGMFAGFAAGGLTALLDRILEGAREEFPALLNRLAEDPPAAICYDAMTLSGKMAAAKLGLPDIALLPTYANNGHFSMRQLMPGPPPEGMVEAWKKVGQLIHDFAAEQGVGHLKFMGGPPASLNISFIPREFQPAGETFDGSFHFVGPCLGERGDDGAWQPRASDVPLLFVSLGTTPLNDQPDFFRKCLQAFAGLPLQVAMAVGERIDVSELGSLPDNVEVRPFFPQLEVLRHANAFLSHTGMNSTMEALYYAVPIVAYPLQPEQEANARRVEDLGLGRRLPREGLTPELIRQTVLEVSGDPVVRGNLDAMSQRIRGSGGAPAAADAIEDFLTSSAAGVT
ncbi:macrolide family glycosyltransferase [Arthrobacter sp. NyZ413]|uniref:macrolide family glycosyltransferase n=1 Tax=Arthrobacter sp. NyZ413 TaxID=3144669 RepID=UPI003BF78E89